MRSIRTIFIIFMLIAAQVGCATPPKPYSGPYTLPPPPSEEARTQFGTIGLVPARYNPESNFQAFARDRASGAARGALGGATAGALIGTGMMLSTTPLGVLLWPFLIGIGSVAGGVAGGAAGAVQSVPAADSEAIEAAITRVIDNIDIQEAMAGHVLHAADSLTGGHLELPGRHGPVSDAVQPDYRPLKNKGVDTLLEVRVKNLGFEGGKGENPFITLFMNVQARLIRTSDNKEMYSAVFEYKSRDVRLSVWAEDNGRLLKAELDHCFRDIAGRISDEVFLVYDFPLSYWSAYQLCMLSPLSPAYEYHIFSQVQFTKVDSLQPTFQWESFPRERDKDADRSGVLESITGIAYDLRIWKIVSGYPLHSVYEQKELPASTHTIEQPLDASSQYFWSVRARFRLDGKQRATRWSYSRVPWIVPMPHPGLAILAPPVDPCGISYIPEPNYFRFITPSE